MITKAVPRGDHEHLHVEIFHRVSENLDLLVSLEDKSGTGQGHWGSSSGHHMDISITFAGVHPVVVKTD